MNRLVIATFALAALLGACGEDAPAVPDGHQPPATLAELTGPWRARPFLLDPALRAQVEAVCRKDMERLPGSVTAVMDARGGGFVSVRMTGQSAGECGAIAIRANGQVVGAGGGGRMDGVEVVPATGDLELGSLEVSGSGGGEFLDTGFVLVFGRAGVGIKYVEIEPVLHPKLQATLENGWFGGWWPAKMDMGLGRDLARGLFEFVARGYDGGGLLVAEKRP